MERSIPFIQSAITRRLTRACGGRASRGTSRRATDEQAVRPLDESWNDVYLRNDRSAFAEILFDDFCATFHDGRTGSKGI